MGDVIPLRPRSAPAQRAGRSSGPAPERIVAPVAPPRSAEPLWREVLGRELRDERLRRGERIADVAGRAGVSPQYLSELERGRKDPSSEILAAVSGALDLSVRQLTSGAGRGFSRGPVCLAA